MSRLDQIRRMSDDDLILFLRRYEGLRENIINGFVLHCTDAARAKARESR